MNGIGGDLFAIYWEAKTGKLYGLNASGWAPKASPSNISSKGIHQMPQNGIDSVTVPGAVDGWAKLHDRFGKLPGATSSSPPSFMPATAMPFPRSWMTTGRPGCPTLMHESGEPACLSCPATRRLRSGRFSATLILPRPHADREPRRSRFLQGSDRAGNPEDLVGTWRDHDGRGPGRVFGRVGRAHLDCVTAVGQSMNSHPTATAWPRWRCSTSWSNSSPIRRWSAQPGRIAHPHRGDEAGLRRRQGL